MWCRSEVQQQVGFLQMMRWMLDTNFCGINGVAQKAGISIGIKNNQNGNGKRVLETGTLN